MSKRKNGIPAVSLIRMSSSQQEASPDQQRAENKKLEKRYGCKIIREYFDDSISGDATSKRKDFQRLVVDAEEKHDFEVILCWDQDRFGRFDSIEAGYWIKPLRDRGIRLITFAQGEIDWNDFAGRMMYAIQQEGKYQFLVDLSRNSLRGQIEAVRRGGSCSKPAYGYDRLFFDESGNLVRRVPYGEKFNKPRGWTSKFVPSDEPGIVATVKWVFDTFANTDCSLCWLISALNERKPPLTPANGWSERRVRYMLTNPVYIGTRAFGRRATGKYHQLGPDGIESQQGKGDRKGKAPITVKESHEALVDQDTFERVQRKLEERKVGNTRPRFGGYLLSGVLRCGHCGAVLAGDSAGFGDGHHTSRYYRCRKKANGLPKCPSARIRQDAIESYVLDYVHQRLSAPGTVEAIEQAIHRQAKAKHSFRNGTRSLKAQITALDKKIAKGTENLLLADPGDMGDLSRLLADWRGNRTRLQSEWETATANPTRESPDQMAKRAVREIKRLRTHLKTGDPMQVRAVVKSLIAEIPLWWEPHGKQRRLARGLIVERDARGVFQHTSAGGWCRFP